MKILKKEKYDLCYLEDPSLCKVTKPVRLAGISQNKRSIYLSKKPSELSLASC